MASSIIRPSAFHVRETPLTLPIDSIKSVSTKAYNTGVYLATASVISVGFIVGLAYFAISRTTFLQWREAHDALIALPFGVHPHRPEIVYALYAEEVSSDPR